MLRIIIVSSKEQDEDKFNPCAAFLSKTKSIEYINNIQEKCPSTLFHTDVVNLEDIEDMKLWQIITKCDHRPELIFYDKESAKSAIELLEYPPNTKLKEHILKGPEFINKFMDDHGIKYYKHYQVLFKENGDIDTSDPKSNTIEDYYTKNSEIVVGEAVVINDDPSSVLVYVYYNPDDPIYKDDLLSMSKIARSEYIHSKYDLEY